MKPISRRSYLKRTGLLAAASVMPGFIARTWSAPQDNDVPPEPTATQRQALTDIAREFLKQSNCPGLSVAISKHGRIVFAEGFGFAAGQQRVTTSHLFRIASVSKPITSVAIYTLLEQGKLKLTDPVFGKDGILGADFPGSNQPFVEEITIHHLLTHTCGGWGNRENDPMFRETQLNHRDLIAWTLKTHPLKNKPGAKYEYSNFGYCLLGRVVEKLSGQSYEAFVRSYIFEKCGIEQMRLAGNTLAERVKNEVIYYGHNGENPYKMNVRRMDSHGGWIASPTEMVKFAMHVDRKKTTPNILSEKTISLMTEATTANKGYASGWAVNAAHNWWHTGSLPGTASILVRTVSGLCWAAFANTRNPKINLDSLMWKMAKAVPAWKA